MQHSLYYSTAVNDEDTHWLGLKVATNKIALLDRELLHRESRSVYGLLLKLE